MQRPHIGAGQGHIRWIFRDYYRDPPYDTKAAAGKHRYTVAQIAEQLGVSRATIYRHLDPDKPDSA
ncbi:helix-turn-helix domain-containing protein [Streptosporangium canum]|uniref:helix-turn-helix domain-containing protein n=1 Tax=Streptosporangium canum TaxID=324952 RepID=UPI00344106D5